MFIDRLEAWGAWATVSASPGWRPAFAALAVLTLLLVPGTQAAAQWPRDWQRDSAPQALPPPPTQQRDGGRDGGFTPGGSRNPVCQRLEGQLAALERGPGGERAEQIRRHQEAADRQESEIERMNAQARRMGCGGGGFFLFGGGQSAQCDQVNRQIQRMRANLDSIQMNLRQLQAQGGGPDNDDRRRAVLASLAQYDCGPQYRTAAVRQQPGGFFEQLFGGSTLSTPETAPGHHSSTYRTLCVRTCDGYFFPISFSTVPDRFQDDERACQRMCPAAEVMLFSHRNPGEEVAQAVSTQGQTYTELPNAFRYQKQFDAACTCRRQDASWADALANDDTLERGDIVVTEDRAKALSQPKQPQPSGQQSRPRSGASAQRGAGDARTGRRAAGATGEPASASPPPAEEPPAAPPAAPPTRAVGPQFYR